MDKLESTFPDSEKSMQHRSSAGFFNIETFKICTDKNVLKQLKSLNVSIYNNFWIFNYLR